MPSQSWMQLLAPQQQAAAAAKNTYTTAVSVINPQSLVDLWRNFWAIGTKMRVKVRFGLSNIVTTPGTVTFQIMMGSIVVWTSGAIQLNATAHTLVPCELDVTLRCDIVGTGTTAKLYGQGRLTGPPFTRTIAATDLWGRVSAADNSVSDVTILVPITTPADGGGFDSTISNLLDFWTGFSISNIGNAIQIFDYEVEGLNYSS